MLGVSPWLRAGARCAGGPSRAPLVPMQYHGDSSFVIHDLPRWSFILKLQRVYRLAHYLGDGCDCCETVTTVIIIINILYIHHISYMIYWVNWIVHIDSGENTRRKDCAVWSCLYQPYIYNPYSSTDPPQWLHLDCALTLGVTRQ